MKRNALVEKAEELLRRRQQGQQHPAGQVQDTASANAVPRNRVGVLVVLVRLVGVRDQVRDRQPSCRPGAIQVVITVAFKPPVALFR